MCRRRKGKEEGKGRASELKKLPPGTEGRWTPLLVCNIQHLLTTAFHACYLCTLLYLRPSMWIFFCLRFLLDASYTTMRVRSRSLHWLGGLPRVQIATEDVIYQYENCYPVYSAFVYICQPLPFASVTKGLCAFLL